MRLFDCPSCGARLYFGNTGCTACGQEVVYAPEADRMVPLAGPCANRGEIGCNWPAEGGALCRACAMTSVIPDTLPPENRAHWAEAERAKRWVLAGLGRWGWFRAADSGPRPSFALLAEATAGGPVEISMGHLAGTITLNVSEADPALLAARRAALGERLRTVIGHVRHEIGHFLFSRLVPAEGFAPGFRALFGDERTDYADALARHYRSGPPPGWEAAHVTGYASAHPHEDWAESAAHLLHLVDIADSAAAAGLGIEGLARGEDAYAEADAARLLDVAARLGLALNHVTRAMGLEDPYPFVLAPPVREKLAFAHGWLRAGPPGAETGPGR
jgi:hypothetical protein